MKTKEYNIETLSFIDSYAMELIQSGEMESGRFSEDYLLDRFTVRFNAYIASHKVEEKTITRYIERPSFFDWLLRRRKRVKYTVTVKDIAKVPLTQNDRRILIIDNL